MNTPNKITLIRIFLIPLVVFFYLANFVPYGKIISLVILIIAETTDFLDGYLARKNNQVTDLGKFLDPIADKVLVMAALLLVVADGTIPAPYGVIVAIIILGRELMISAFRQIAATKNFVMAADFWGKLKTIFQDITLPALFLFAFLKSINTVAWFYTTIQIFAFVTLGIAIILTVLSACNYLLKNKNVLK